ncbi:hypothetical protein K2X30_08385 [bacterium]|nr:hypothetical protein [bacterium]
MMRRVNQNLCLVLTLGCAASLTSCSTFKSAFALNQETGRTGPILNPFESYSAQEDPRKENIILRTKKGDRAVEVEIPGAAANMTDFVVPVSPAFTADNGRAPASYGGGDAMGVDESYRDRKAGMSDKEITHHFPQGPAENREMRDDVEGTLGVQASEESLRDQDQSYLASVDRVKQLYKYSRYEAALLETDDLLRKFPTDPKLYAMRGTLLERIGQHDLAMKSWAQALKMNPANQSLKKFLDRKQQVRGVAGQ